MYVSLPVSLHAVGIPFGQHRHGLRRHDQFVLMELFGRKYAIAATLSFFYLESVGIAHIAVGDCARGDNGDDQLKKASVGSIICPKRRVRLTRNSPRRS